MPEAVGLLVTILRVLIPRFLEITGCRPTYAFRPECTNPTTLQRLIELLLAATLIALVLVPAMALVCPVRIMAFELIVVPHLTLAFITGDLAARSGIVRSRTPEFTSVWPVLLPLRKGTTVAVMEIITPGDMLTQLVLEVLTLTNLL